VKTIDFIVQTFLFLTTTVKDIISIQNNLK